MTEPSPHLLQSIVSESSTVDHNKYVSLRCSIKPPQGVSIENASARLALTLTIDTFRPGAYPELSSTLRDVLPRVSILNPGQDWSSVELSFPVPLLEPWNGVSQLLTVMFFGFEYNFVDEFSIEGISFPEEYLKHFNGPKVGADSLRKSLAVDKRPVTGIITKPRLGGDLDHVAERARMALTGDDGRGLDMLVDDELVVDPRSTSLSCERRMDRLAKVVQSARSATKESKLYVANVSARPSRMTEIIKAAARVGVDVIQLNGFTVGYPVLEDLSRGTDWPGPIFSCNLGTAVVSRPSRMKGASEVVIALITRISGADGINTGIEGSTWYSPRVVRGVLDVMRTELPGNRSIKPSIPVVAGGLTIGNTWQNLLSYGRSAVFEYGGEVTEASCGLARYVSGIRRLLDELDPAWHPDEGQQRISELRNKRGSPIADAFGNA